MGRYIGPNCRLCRAVGEKLFLKGSHCQTGKCALEKRNLPPGKQSKRFKKLSDYAIRLKEKQKLRWMFGLREKQFRRFFAQAERKRGATGEILLQLLLRRLDHIVYSMGFANSLKQARQLITHRFFRVEGKKVNIPSYIVGEQQMIEVEQGKRDKLKRSLDTEISREVPGWLSVEKDKFRGKVIRIPPREEITIPVDEKLIVELYSR